VRLVASRARAWLTHLRTTTIGLGVLSATPRPFHIISADEMTVANASAWVRTWLAGGQWGDRSANHSRRHELSEARVGGAHVAEAEPAEGRNLFGKHVASSCLRVVSGWSGALNWLKWAGWVGVSVMAKPEPNWLARIDCGRAPGLGPTGLGV